jgi:CheY-like chemotaxis protein
MMNSPCLDMVDRLHDAALPEQTGPRRRHARATIEDRPRREEHGAGGHSESSTPRGARLPRNLVGLKVVVVDDDSGSLEYFASALRICGAVVATAPTAIEALRLIQEERPDIVLSDIAMVDQDGYWLVHEIRGLADRPTSLVPVVATTAFSREHSRERALAAGFSELLPKPVDPEVLCRTIASAAGR